MMAKAPLSLGLPSGNTGTAGLCATCANVKIVRSDRGAIFYRCLLSDKNPEFAKYPSLPVLSCRGWKKADPQNRA